MLNLVKLLRVHQWVKNLLLFIPALTAHRLNDPWILKQSVLAFMSFSFVASSVYILNDWWDLSHDKLHPRKKNRPLASGRITVQQALGILPVILGLGMGLGFVVGISFLKVLLVYLLLTSAYSFFLKRILLLDVLSLAGLYTVRIFAGSVATDILVSKWLLAFSLFIFMSLAFVKRFAELKAAPPKEGSVLPGRGYQSIDLETLRNLGASSGYLSVLVFALYINSSEVTQFYKNPQLLWFTCPMILYWISRVWVIAGRGHLQDDPVVFALTDRASYFVFASTVLVLWMAT